MIERLRLLPPATQAARFLAAKGSEADPQRGSILGDWGTPQRASAGTSAPCSPKLAPQEEPPDCATYQNPWHWCFAGSIISY